MTRHNCFLRQNDQEEPALTLLIANKHEAFLKRKTERKQK